MHELAEFSPIGLLNAILELSRPITDVTIQNPFSYQEFENAKVIVLDVKARDSAGRIFNIEMQIAIHPGLLQRMIYHCGSSRLTRRPFPTAVRWLDGRG
jgi:predicted transposase/invertase (TIGR01784 family)